MGILHDVRFGVRMMVKNPGFTLAAILALALGIGVNSTIFTLVNAALLNGLPFDRPDEIMEIRSNRGTSSYLDFLDYRAQSRAFKGIAGFSPLNADLSDVQSAAERVTGASVTSNMFSLLGRGPLIGRDFAPEDEKPGAVPVALLSHFLWEARYGRRPDVLGATIRVNLQTYTVVGVMPEGEEFPQATRLWIPLIQDQNRQRRDQRNVDIVGRLADGATVESARAELKTISSRLAQSYPETNKDIETLVRPYTERGTGGPIRVVLYAMQGAVAFVLLIACANVANLFLSRAVRRMRETSVRTALGASRWRIVRQLLIESVMLSFIGGLLGSGLAYFGVRWFDAAVADTGKPYWIVFELDANVLLFFVAICVATGILFGLAPALQISKTNTTETLKEGGRGGSSGTRGKRLINVLLVAEVALTFVLLVGAGLMMRSFLNTQRFDIGIDTRDLMTVQVQPPESRYSQPADRLAFQERLTERLRTIPGIDKLTIASQPPAGGAQGRTLSVAGRQMTDANNRLPIVGRIAVLPDYFDTLDIKVRGREFSAADGAPGAEVAIVNQPFVTRYFSGGEVIGKQIRLGQDLNRGAEDPNAPLLTIVGVSPAVLQQGGPNQDQSIQPAVYVPFRQEPTIAFTVLARSRIPRANLIASLRSELRNVDPDIPLYNIRSMDDIIRQRVWPMRVFGTLFTAFALIAIVLSAVGIYAVTSYGVGQRTQEIGIRMALGASDRDVMWLVLRQGVRRIGIGVVIGLLAAWGLARVLASVLVQVSPDDPLTFVSITVLLAVVTLAACLAPARRAMRLDPVDSLRTE